MDTYSTSEMFEKHRECLKSIITNKNGTKMSRNEKWKKKYLRMLNVDINVVQQLTWKWCSWSGLVNESKNGATEVEGKMKIEQKIEQNMMKWNEVKLNVGLFLI